MPNTDGNQQIRVIIITGLSGAGKSQAVNCLEDLGFYCVDNLPPALLEKFIELSMQSESSIRKVALVIDSRGGDFFNDLNHALQQLEPDSVPYSILFLEASDDVLVRRFKETRRPHPLSQGGSVLEAIKRERRMLEELRGEADLVIDTSMLNSRELRDILITTYNEGEKNFAVSMTSFGYKSGIPMDSDIVMDVRFLPNPFYDPEMKNMTGQDQAVIDFVLGAEVTQSFCAQFMEILNFLIPYYVAEGKSNLAIAIGCTGGQHRSVALADYFMRLLEEKGHTVLLRHRDVKNLKAVFPCA